MRSTWSPINRTTAYPPVLKSFQENPFTWQLNRHGFITWKGQIQCLHFDNNNRTNPASSRVYACINAKWWPRGSHLTWMETTNTFVFESVPLRFVSRFLSFSREKKKEGFQMFFLGFNSASFEAQVEDVIEERILRGKQAKKQLPEKV